MLCTLQSKLQIRLCTYFVIVYPPYSLKQCTHPSRFTLHFLPAFLSLRDRKKLLLGEKLRESIHSAHEISRETAKLQFREEEKGEREQDGEKNFAVLRSVKKIARAITD